MAGEKIGVLLPVRIETKFIEPSTEGDPWRLKIAVVPDEASMNRHNPRVSEGEFQRLEAAWRVCEGDLASEMGRAAFHQLAGEVGAARASWMLRTFPPNPGEAGEMDWTAEHVIDWTTAEANMRWTGDYNLSRIEGLPDEIWIWLGIQEGNQIRLEPLDTPLTVHQDKLLFDDKFRLFTENRSWIEDAGLSATLVLPFASSEQLDSIAFIIAVGLGSARPEPLFQNHRDAGSLSILPYGQPTNTISGEPAANLALDAETWWQLVLEPIRQWPVESLAHALTGNSGALDPLPGARNEDANLETYLIGGLWSALWGHTLRDIWTIDRDGGENNTARLGYERLFMPEGPLPPVRLGAQAYGVLPATSLQGWRNGWHEIVLSGLIPLLVTWRDEWARLAEIGTGTAVGQETERLLDMLARVPNSSSYDYRRFLPLQSLLALASGLGQPIDPDVLQDEWERRTGEPARQLLNVDPIRRYATFGWPQVIDLPLVEPLEPLSPAEDEVVASGGSLFFESLRAVYELGRDYPDLGVFALCRLSFQNRHPQPQNSLLLRLLIYSAAQAHAELIQLISNGKGPFIEPLIQDETIICRWLSQNIQIDGNPRRMTFRHVLEPQGDVANVTDSPQFSLCYSWLESIQALLDLYDRAMTIGPEAVQDLLSSIDRIFRSTLDTALMRVDPWITGLAERRLRELRAEDAGDALGVYGWVDKPYTGQPGPTKGGIIHAPSEAQLRAAIVLRDKKVSDPTSNRWKINLDSRQVRMASQIAGEVRAGSPLQEVLGRMVEQIVADPGQVRQLRDDSELWIRREHAGRRVIDGQKALARDDAFFTSLGLDQTNQAELNELRKALDAYSDLLVVDAVFNVTNGRPERAGELMEAAAGLGIPPELEMLRTPRRGRGTTTRVLLALRDMPAPTSTEPGVSPTALADPAAAAFLNRQWPLNERQWQTDKGLVKLGQLGLSPADTLALSEDTLHQLVESKTGGGRIVEDEVQSPGLVWHKEIKRLARLLTGECWQDQADELCARYERLYAAAELMRNGLRDSQPKALVHARRWGIVPPTLAGDATAVDIRVSRFAKARESIQSRLDLAPPKGVLTPETPVHQIVFAITELASPGGGFPIFGRTSRTELDALLPQYDLGAQPSARRFTQLRINRDLDSDWLEVVAAVRPNLARLESWQLDDRRSPFTAWTNQSNPWKLQPLSKDARVNRTSQLVVVYSPMRTLGNGTLAVAELDAWAETVPDEKHATAAAFGFNAPAAQAPQAILIAVTPDPTQPLDGETLAHIVHETRTLAHARMATLADISQYSGIFPFYNAADRRFERREF